MSFRFRQFFVADEQCAMKVGTDGVLLGAWSRVEALLDVPCRILDVGTGSGLVALMMAQQYIYADITAIDISAEAVGQAQQNFAVSPWGNRLHIAEASLQTFGTDAPFDIILSNPPYFNNSLKAPDLLRSTARHTDTLSYTDLITHTQRLLSDHGHLFLILPAEAESTICTIAQNNSQLALQSICYVQGTTGKPPKRILLHFAMQHPVTTVEPTHLVLQDANNQRTEEYSLLTREFYL